MTARDDIRTTLATIFGRLFENEFATLDGIAISCRTAQGMEYIDGTAGLSLWLGDDVTETDLQPEDASAHAIHEALYAASPDHDAAVSGWSRHLRALLLEGFDPPPSTSMMRNRGVSDIGVHLVEPEALSGPALEATVARARELAAANSMRHTLIATSEGLVVVSGSPPFETMAHWHNVEFAARVECMRLEEAAQQKEGGQP